MRRKLDDDNGDDLAVSQRMMEVLAMQNVASSQVKLSTYEPRSKSAYYQPQNSFGQSNTRRNDPKMTSGNFGGARGRTGTLQANNSSELLNGTGGNNQEEEEDDAPAFGGGGIGYSASPTGSSPLSRSGKIKSQNIDLAIHEENQSREGSYIDN